MADAIVSAVLQQLVTIVDREVEPYVKLVVGVKREVEKMTSTFRTNQAVLADAENRQLKDEAVKVWLDKLKHISYDIDDVLDEWNTALLKSKIDRDEGHKTASIPSLLSKLRSCISSPCSCYGGVALCCGIAVKIKVLNERLLAISKERDGFGFLVDLSGNKNIDPEIERPKTTYFVDVSEIRGRDQDECTVKSMLLRENNSEERGIPIISIVGMGGIGKTTLAQKVYNHHELKNYFQKKIWVCVSDPFDEMRIAKGILEALTDSATSLNELSSVLKKIDESIAGKRYLLVLDDVWNEDEGKWKSLKCCLQSGSQGSRILVTTRKDKVAAIMGCTRLHRLGKLSQEECRSLFSEIAFLGRTNGERENLEDIGEKIADRCDGLPLAAKTLGGLLRFKKSREQWQGILDSPMWELNEVEKGIFSPLLISYYDLPPPLRQCFSYCAIFPKDYEIKKDVLIKLWMAQGFLKETQGKEMEIVGEEYFDDLATRSFFQEFEKDGDDDSIIIGCKMHDIVHDFAQLLRKTECCVAPVGGNGIEDQRAEFCLANVRHLTFIHVNVDSGIPDPTYTLKKLRSLLLFEPRCQYWSSLEASLLKLFDQLTCLRMLVLGKSFISMLPQKIGKLIHLRYLSLEENQRLHELPKALCDLYNLQTLNIRGCSGLRTLPRGMEKLINLKHLQNEGTYGSLIMPKEMGRLTWLQTLEEIVLRRGGGFSLQDLGKLIHLRGQLEIRGLGNVRDASEAREARLSTKAGLRELRLIFDGEDDDEQHTRIENESFVLEALHPPQHLQVLSIGFCKGPALPLSNWMTSLTSLKSVTLYGCVNWESLPPLGKLLSLEFLYLRDLPKVKKVGEEFVGAGTSSSSSSVNHNIIAFPNLKTLEFQYMFEWEEWEYENVLRSRGGDNCSSSSSSNTIITIMPKLQRLSLGGCPKLKMLPRHLLQSRALQQLEIIASLILGRRYNKETGDEWPSISHIPSVYIPLWG